MSGKGLSRSLRGWCNSADAGIIECEALDPELRLIGSATDCRAAWIRRGYRDSPSRPRLLDGCPAIMPTTRVKSRWPSMRKPLYTERTIPYADAGDIMRASLDLNPDIVCALITRFKEFHAKEAVVIPEAEGSWSDDWALQVLADHADDLTYQEISTTIEDLEPDQQASLVALMWTGRGDYDENEWTDALAEATRSATNRTAAYLLTTPMVADYLAEGLAAFGHTCEE